MYEILSEKINDLNLEPFWPILSIIKQQELSKKYDSVSS